MASLFIKHISEMKLSTRQKLKIPLKSSVLNRPSSAAKNGKINSETEQATRYPPTKRKYQLLIKPKRKLSERKKSRKNVADQNQQSMLE